MFDLFEACEKFLKLAETKTTKKKKKLDPHAKVRSRGKCVFPANKGKNKSSKDHFPINDADQARNAISRVNQYDSAPEWYDGSLKELVSAVVRKVHAEYPSIKVTEKAKKPGKG